MNLATLSLKQITNTDMPNHLRLHQKRRSRSKSSSDSGQLLFWLTMIFLDILIVLYILVFGVEVIVIPKF